MPLCRCEESLLFRSVREVYVYQRGRTHVGSPPLLFQDSLSRRENPSGMMAPLPRSSFPAGRFAAGGQGQNCRSKKKNHPKGVVFGGPKGIRTLDLSDANRTLSQLSYGPMCLTREIRALNCVWDVARVTTA